SQPAGPETSPALLYAPIPFLIWAALRFGVGGTCASMLIITILAIGGMMRGRGPFLIQTPEENALALQLFLLVTAVPLLFLAVVIDEERISRSALHESETRFRSVADTAPVMIWVTGTDKLCTFVSKGWLDFTGRTLEEELGNGWADNVHREDYDRCLAVYENSFDARKPFEMEYRLRRKDGEYRRALDIGTPRYSADGVFLGYIGSCIDVSALKLAEEAAHQLTGHLIHAQEETRKELARELHDDFCQSLALLAVELDIFRRNPPLEPIVIAAQMENFSAQVKRMASGVHELSHELHPAKLDQLGLVAAMRGFCKEFALVHEMAIEFAERDVPRTVPDDTALCLYRIAQEALHNVLKHSRGCVAKCELAGDEEYLRLIITDDGAGFDPQVARTKGSLGLISMGERARFVGGYLNVESHPGAGTRIEVRVPIVGARASSTQESEMEGSAYR
ncbi:MAG TPA: PAS domain S-box protein, partial [Chthoniobacter sp.]|nr:PAS domain S-box protein [Chthoniobacter sp.]